MHCSRCVCTVRKCITIYIRYEPVSLNKASKVSVVWFVDSHNNNQIWDVYSRRSGGERKLTVRPRRRSRIVLRIKLKIMFYNCASHESQVRDERFARWKYTGISYFTRVISARAVFALLKNRIDRINVLLAHVNAPCDKIRFRAPCDGLCHLEY